MKRAYNKIMLFRPKPPVLDKVSFPRNPRLPIDLAFASICLKKYRYEPFLLDCQINRDADPLEFSKKCDLIVVSCTYFDIPYVISMSSKIKECCKDKIIVVIGQQATEHPESFVYKGSPIDFVLLGETEEQLIALLGKLNKNKPLSGIRSLYSKEHKGSRTEMIQYLDKLPFLEHLQGYDYIYPVKIRKKSVWGHLLSTRGCPYPCIFCSQMSRKTFGKQARNRSGKNVAEEIMYLKRQGVSVVLFNDDNFTTSKKHVLDVCKELQLKKSSVGWVVHARVDELDEVTISEMKKSGCILLRLGIESGSNKIISMLKKRYKPIGWVTQTKKVVSIANNLHLPVLGLFIIGNPKETEKELLESMRLAREIRPDLIQVHFFAPYHGTDAFKLYNNRNSGGEVYHHTCQDIQTSEIPNERLKHLYIKFFYGFYLRPKFLANHLWSYKRFYLTNIPSWIKLAKIGLWRRLS